ncbi:MAG: hypothetical protein RJA36_1475 [Pseudomonadota bacterium]|jgi:hypothetical protein
MSLKPSDVVRDPKLFNEWWNRRDLGDDRLIVATALRAGLIRREDRGTHDLLVLTQAGRKLREQAWAPA